MKLDNHMRTELEVSLTYDLFSSRNAEKSLPDTDGTYQSIRAATAGLET